MAGSADQITFALINPGTGQQGQPIHLGRLPVVYAPGTPDRPGPALQESAVPLQKQIDDLRLALAHHSVRHELSGEDEIRLSVLNGTTQLNRQRSLAAGTGLTAAEVQGANPYINLTAAPAFIGAPFVTVGNDSTLTAERALTGTANQVTVTDNGANSSVVLSLPQNIHTGASPTFAGATLTGFTDITGGGLRVKGSAALPSAAPGTTDSIARLVGEDSATAVQLTFHTGATQRGFIGFDNTAVTIAGTAKESMADLVFLLNGVHRAFFDNSNAGMLILGGGARADGSYGYSLAGTTSGIVTVRCAASAGNWTMTLPTGVGAAGQQLTDAAGDGVCSWAAASSLRAHKTLLGHLLPVDALNAIRAAPIHLFRYKEGMGTQDDETVYAGPVADETPWAMHYRGSIFNPVSAFGYTAAAIQALVEDLGNVVAVLTADQRAQLPAQTLALLSNV